jgi:predicted Zn finger-like uncharacterized protein
MTDTQLTQCPHCKASFKVSEEQLSVANGRVRCGACLNIFDAIAYRINTPLIDDEDEELARRIASMEKELSMPDEAIDLESELLFDSTPKQHSDSEDLPRDAIKDDSSDDTLFADDPEEDKQEKGYRGSGKFSDELSTTFLALESSSDAPFGADHHADELIAEEATDNIDESWAASILNDLDEPEQPQEKSAAPSQKGPLSDQPDTESPAIQATQEFSLSDLTSNAETLRQGKTTDHLQHNDHSLDKHDLNALSFQYDQDQPAKFKWLLWSLLGIINVALLLLLAAQASWYHYEKLAKYPKVAALYEFACQHLGCTLPELSDVSKITSRGLVVKSHPTVFKALIIETVMTNQAAFDQPFPDISLSFSDLNNNIIAQRLFRPHEYLTSEISNWPAMPSGQPIQITLEIIDPGPQAVNYSVEFYRHTLSEDVQKSDQMSTNKSKI